MAGRGVGLKQGVAAIGAEGEGAWKTSNGMRSIGVQPQSLMRAREGRLV